MSCPTPYTARTSIYTPKTGIFSPGDFCDILLELNGEPILQLNGEKISV